MSIENLQKEHLNARQRQNMYYAELLNGLVKQQYDIHKSRRYHDGNLCFGGGWFVVVAMLPDGLTANHYPEKDWHLFRVQETEKAKCELEGIHL